MPVVLAVATGLTAGLMVTAPLAAATSVTVTDLTAAMSPFTLTRMKTADATVTFQVTSEGGQTDAPEVRDGTKAVAFAPTKAVLTSGDRTEGVWQATVRLGSVMDGTHVPRVHVCVTDTTCVNRQLTTDIVVRGSDWPIVHRVRQRPARLREGQVQGAIADGRVVFSVSHDPASGLTVRLVRNIGGGGAVVDRTDGQGQFTSPWPWRKPGQDPARLSLTSSALPGVRIAGTMLGNPHTRFLVPPPTAPVVAKPGHRVTVRGVVTPGYPASRLGSVRLQLRTHSGWVTRDRAHLRPLTTASGPRNRARYRLSTRFDNSGRHVLRIVKSRAMCEGGDCRVAGNESKRFSLFIGDRDYYVERRLSRLHVPVGTVDGVIDARSRQAFCAWRDMTGKTPSRSGTTPRLVRSVLGASSLPAPHRAKGLYVNKTCQVLMQVKHHAFKRVVWVSTGMPGYETPNGTGAIFRKVKGWVESSLYPGAYMLDPMFFLPDRPGIAIHGSVSNDLVHPHPASHGCVRTWRPQIRKIFAESPIGTKVRVYGKY